MTMLRLILAVVLAVGAGAFVVPPPGCSRVCAPKGAYPLTVVTSRTRAATIALHAKKTKESDVIEVDGIVKESLPNAKFRVELVATKNVIVCSTSGKMRKNFVRVLVGDPVKVELSPYDLTRGRITYRSKGPGKKTVDEKPLEKAEERPAEKPEEGAGE